MFYRPNSEHAGRAQDYAEEYGRRHPGWTIELMDADGPEAVDKVRLYGITNYPAIVALSNDGGLQQLWQDEQLPLMSELDFYQQA